MYYHQQASYHISIQFAQLHPRSFIDCCSILRQTWLPALEARMVFITELCLLFDSANHYYYFYVWAIIYALASLSRVHLRR